MSNDLVTLRYLTTETGKLRHCTLSVQEFIRRFLQHVLPRGFVKVRYYRFFAPGLRHRLQLIRQQPGQPVALSPEDAADADVPSTRSNVPTPIPCPHCGQSMRRQQRLWPRSRYPLGV
ncbi:MAG: transposase [Chloroflexi bacterium]|nr:transposase [Chloroflexota bacterium]